MPQVFRCKICGEAYVGNSKPSHCPYCGAHVLNLVDAKDYKEQKVSKLTAVSKKNLEFTFDLEIKASQIYQCMRKKSKDEFIVGMMKSLSKVELEHAEIAGKILGKSVDCSIPFKQELCTEDRAESLEKTKQLETDAIAHYKKFLKEATEQRVKEIFTALIEVEKDHLDLVDRELK